MCAWELLFGANKNYRTKIKMPMYKVRSNGADCQKFFINGVAINEIISKGELFEHNLVYLNN